jgi:hypothetical protein
MTHGCKGNLLKIKEEKYKGENGGAQVEARSPENMFLHFRCF